MTLVLLLGPSVNRFLAPGLVRSGRSAAQNCKVFGRRPGSPSRGSARPWAAAHCWPRSWILLLPLRLNVPVTRPLGQRRPARLAPSQNEQGGRERLLPPTLPSARISGESGASFDAYLTGRSCSGAGESAGCPG